MFIPANKIASDVGQRRFHCRGCGYTAFGPTATRWHECPTPLTPPCGPGCQLRRTLSWFGLHDNGTCGCEAFAAKMDAWGDSCWGHMEEIVDHLRQAAAKRGLPFLATAARIAVARAIEAARTEATSATSATPPPG